MKPCASRHRRLIGNCATTLTASSARFDSAISGKHWPSCSKSVRTEGHHPDISFGTAAMAAANMQPIKTFVMRPDLLPRCAGARGTSCPAKRSAWADELVHTLVLPPASLASSLSRGLDTCASHAACTRQSGSSGSISAIFVGLTSPLNRACFIGVSFSELHTCYAQLNQVQPPTGLIQKIASRLKDKVPVSRGLALVAWPLDPP